MSDGEIDTDQPVHTEWDVTTCGAVALVAVRLTNPTAVAQPIRLDNRLAGPVLAPRRHGIPEGGWDADGFSGTVPPGKRLALGYACPLPSEEQGKEAATATEPPVGIRIDRVGRREDEEITGAAVIRDLGESRPPADAVPLTTGRTGSVDGTTGERAPEPEQTNSNGPRPPTAWLDAVEARIERAEQLDGASVAEATAIVRDCGGVAGVQAETAQLRREARQLDDLATRTGALAARADAVAVPVDALRRLA